MDEGGRRVKENDYLIEILKRTFEANPTKSTIELKKKCSDCGREVTIEITSTSGGFGLNGGVLFKHNSLSYILKCSDCIKS
jgi:hypothetical protein